MQPEVMPVSTTAFFISMYASLEYEKKVSSGENAAPRGRGRA